MNDIWKLTRILPDKLYLQIMYFKHFHKFINFKNPISFNEKLQWLKIYDRKPEYTTMVDKHLAKEYVASKIGREYIIPTLGVWEKAEDIDFDALPNQFVLKCNNDSGGIVICKDKSKLNKEEAIRLLSSRLNNNGFWYGREWPYKNVKPYILAEKYMEDMTTGEKHKDGLTDYKVHVFNGRPRFILVCKDRYGKNGMTETFFTDHWEKMNMRRTNQSDSLELIPKPAELEQMLNLATVLADNMPFLRVDFYVVNHKLYFGELTFYPASGFKAFEPQIWDRQLGDYLTL